MADLLISSPVLLPRNDEEIPPGLRCAAGPAPLVPLTAEQAEGPLRLELDDIGEAMHPLARLVGGGTA